MSRQPQRWELEPPGRWRPARLRLGFGAVLSLACHLLILLWLAWTPRPATRALQPGGMILELVDGRRFTVMAAAATPAPAANAKAAPGRDPGKPVPTAPDRDPQPSDPAHPADPGPEISGARLAGAASAEAGVPGGGCDLAGRLQAVLRADPRVPTAVARYSGKAIMVWDGDWVMMPGDIGKGLTAVRQAMEWEIAYAPETCRARPMHGLVVFTLNGEGGPVRLAVGLENWRWTDLLGAPPST